jgi:hypothetical protein
MEKGKPVFSKLLVYFDCDLFNDSVSQDLFWLCSRLRATDIWPPL